MTPRSRQASKVIPRRQRPSSLRTSKEGKVLSLRKFFLESLWRNQESKIIFILVLAHKTALKLNKLEGLRPTTRLSLSKEATHTLVLMADDTASDTPLTNLAFIQSQNSNLKFPMLKQAAAKSQQQKPRRIQEHQTSSTTVISHLPTPIYHLAMNIYRLQMT